MDCRMPTGEVGRTRAAMKGTEMGHQTCVAATINSGSANIRNRGMNQATDVLSRER